MSNTDAIASRQRDWRTRAKSRIESRGNCWYSDASCRSRGSPSPDQADASTTSRSVDSSKVWVGTVPSGGSPGHQTVTGRSWISSGATRADRWRPVSPPAVRKMSSVQVSGASARGRTQWASIFASSHGGPSGSAARTITVRDGCRPVSFEIVSAARAPTSGCRATTTRFITEVRAAMCRPPASSVGSSIRLGCAQIRASSCSISSIVCAVDDQRIVGSPGFGGSARAMRPPPAGRVPMAMIWPYSRDPPDPPDSTISARPPRDPSTPGSDPAPAPALAGQQVVRGLGAPGAGLVVGEVGHALLGPGLDDRVDDGPRLLHLVRAREERGVAQERVEDQRLVRVGAVDLEGGAIREVHRDVPDVDAEARDLRAEAQHDPLVGLDPHREQVGLRVRGAVAEQPVGDVLELDRDLRRALRQPLAHPEVERDTGPAPVVDGEPRRDERL